MTITFDGDTRDLRWNRNASGGGPKRNVILKGIKDKWINLTVNVSLSQKERPIVIQVNKVVYVPENVTEISSSNITNASQSSVNMTVSSQSYHIRFGAQAHPRVLDSKKVERVCI